MRLSSNTRWAIAIFLIVYLGHAFSRVTTAFDSRWSIPIALSLIERGDTNIDEYAAMRQGTDEPVVSAGGHYYDWYPIGTPVLATPFVWALKLVSPAAAPWIAKLGIHSSDRVTAAFLSGDLLTGLPRVEVVISSIFVASTAALLFWIARRFLPVSPAVFLALLFAFATSAWSTASRGLWQHSPSMLMLTIALALLVGARERPALAAWSAIPVACAYVIRPLNSLAVVLVTLYVACYYRRYLIRYLVLAAPVAVVFLSYSYSVYHTWLPSYFTQRPWAPAGGLAQGLFADALGTLISPSRGLLVFTPMVVFSFWGMYRAIREGWLRPLTGWMAALLIAHWLLISLFRPIWWGGHCYGPRYFTDVTPLLTFFLIPVFERWSGKAAWFRQPSAVAFLVLTGLSFLIHARGAMSGEVWRWNVDPVSVDVRPERVWDWHDPQFLRGLLPR